MSFRIGDIDLSAPLENGLGGSRHGPLANAWRGVRHRLRGVLAERRRRARVIRELSACSDRELAELGLSRYDFPNIARGTYTP